MVPQPALQVPQAKKRKHLSSGTGKNASSSSRRFESETAARRPAKRPKLKDARRVRTEDVEHALRDKELDLDTFVGSRRFEMEALEESMKKSKVASRTNTFQTVPRSMRRRTASHNPKRVPKRLRARAMREFIENNTPLVVSRRRKPRTTKARLRAETAKRLAILAQKKRRRKAKEKQKAKDAAGGTTISTRLARPKIRRNTLNEPLPVKSKFRKRQINKTWLPTHVWHAKRARMTEPREPLWRFAIPLTPNEKTYRPTHRAQGEIGTIMWDLSYMSTLGLYGHVAGIERVLKALGVCEESCWNAKGQKWRLGWKAWNGMLSRHTGGSRRDVCPAVIVWDPESPSGAGSGGAAPESLCIRRQVFLRVHPSAFLELFKELVRLIRMENPRLYVEDLRFEIGSIEITGPASTESLLGVLTPYAGTTGIKGAHGDMFQSLAGLTNVGAMPAGAVLGFSVQDPRLRYPPRTVQVPDSQGDLLLQTLGSWPREENLDPFQIWNRASRLAASRLSSQKSIDARKGSKVLGAYLEPTAADAPIPILLISHSHRTAGSGTQVQGSWTLLAPWKCIQPIWYCLSRYPVSSGGNPRFGGLDELRQVSFERGQPWFPADFPATDAGLAWELTQRTKRQAEWARRPKSKRIEWQSLDLGAGRKGEIGNGLWCDFESLFPDDGTAMAEDAKQKHLVGHGALRAMARLTKAQFGKLLHAHPQNALPVPAKAMMQVRLTMLSRGVAITCARIYRLPQRAQAGNQPGTKTGEAKELESRTAGEPVSTSQGKLPADLRDQWVSLANGKPRPGSFASSLRKLPLDSSFGERKRHLARSLVADPLGYPPAPANRFDLGGHPLVPDADHLVGFVTSGSFCLSMGKAVGMGSIAVSKVLDCLKGPSGGGAKESRLCIVRNAGESVGRLARWEVL